MTIFHRLQRSLVTYFNLCTFLFTLAKLDIYAFDVRHSYITTRRTNSAYSGLVKFIVAQDETRFLFFIDVG